MLRCRTGPDLLRIEVIVWNRLISEPLGQAGLISIIGGLVLLVGAAVQNGW